MLKYKEIVANLEKLKPTEVWKWNKDIGLDKFKEFMSLLGNPQDQLKFVHLAGTSGKGSTASFLASILKESGYKTGLTLSPHVFSIKERLQINGKIITKSKFKKIFLQLEPKFWEIAKNYGKTPSFYEILLAMAFVYFQQEKCEIVVIETGLGGKLDATNIIGSQWQIITNVGLDHTRILGSTKELILKDKQEIIKNNSEIISGIKENYLKKIISKKAIETNSKILFLNEDFGYKIVNSSVFDFQFKNKSLKNIEINLKGIFQFDNASLAIATSFLMIKKFSKINDKTIKDGIKNAYIPARFQIISQNPIEIWDGAHNPDKTRALIKSIKYYFPNQKFIIVFRYKKRKDILIMIKSLTSISEKIIITGSKGVGDTGFDQIFTQKDIKKIPKEFNIESEEKLEKAYLMAKKYCQNNKTGILVTGSLYMMKELSVYNSHYDHSRFH